MPLTDEDFLDLLVANIKNTLGDGKQLWLAEKAGISTGTLSAILNRKTNPSITKVRAIARALDVSLSSLLPVETDQPP